MARARQLTNLENGCTVIPLPQFLNLLYLTFVIVLKLYPQLNLGKPRTLKALSPGALNIDYTKGSPSVFHPLPIIPFPSGSQG